ncbi:MAG: OmpA family protein [Gammaproteobacteria bacterium]|nr:OmpA family protein [Gammaproteobacteria bacterium]
MKSVKKIIIFSSFLMLLSSCAGPQKLSQQAIFEQYPGIATLKQLLDKGKEDELMLFAPATYQEAVETYEQAIESGKSRSAETPAIAQKGQKELSRAQSIAAQSKDILEEVVIAREKAKKANADQVKKAAFGEAEDELLTLTRLIEANRISKAREGRADLIRQYSALELSAVKETTAAKARGAILVAKKQNIDRLAPKTLKLAEEELALATSTLEADLDNKEKADRHAEKALWHAQRATEIADIITNFRQSDYSSEDIVLWYQQQVAKIVEPLEKNVIFNQNNKLVVNSLNAQIHNLIQENHHLAASLQASKDASLSAQQQTEAVKRRNQALVAKFNFVSKLFSADEADVYQQGNNVLIRAHGFSFPTGRSEIMSNNFGLLNKITEAINQFPGSKVVISGHTDNQGGDAANFSLSQARAQKVAKFLSEVGKLNTKNLSWVGYGKTRPVASNETSSGRAANRRVEILIVNERQ